MLFYLFHPGSSIVCSQSVPSFLASCHDYNLVLFHRNNDSRTGEPRLAGQNGGGAMGSCPPTTFIRCPPDTLFTKYAIGRSRAIASHLSLSLLIRPRKSPLA